MMTATVSKIETEPDPSVRPVAKVKRKSCGYKTCCEKCKARKRRKPDADLEEVTRAMSTAADNRLFEGTLDF